MINLKRKEKKRQKSLFSQNACLNPLIAEPDPASSRIFFFYLLSLTLISNPNLLEERKRNGMGWWMIVFLLRKEPIYRKTQSTLTTQ